MTDIDASKIKPGDLVKVSFEHDDDVWFDIKGWHEVRDRGTHIEAGSCVIRHADGTTVSTVHVRAHKPAPVPLPTEPGTRFRATVMGVPDQVVMRVEGAGLATYVTADEVHGSRWHGPRYITDVHDVVLP